VRRRRRRVHRLWTRRRAATRCVRLPRRRRVTGNTRNGALRGRRGSAQARRGTGPDVRCGGRTDRRRRRRLSGRRRARRVRCGAAHDPRFDRNVVFSRHGPGRPPRITGSVTGSGLCGSIPFRALAVGCLISRRRRARGCGLTRWRRVLRGRRSQGNGRHRRPLIRARRRWWTRGDLSRRRRRFELDARGTGRGRTRGRRDRWLRRRSRGDGIARNVFLSRRRVLRRLAFVEEPRKNAHAIVPRGRHLPPCSPAFEE